MITQRMLLECTQNKKKKEKKALLVSRGSAPLPPAGYIWDQTEPHSWLPSASMFCASVR